MERHGLGILAALLATAAAVAALSATALAGLGPNPADHRSLVDKRIEGYRYDGAKRCTGKNDIPKGSKRLVDWLERHTGGSFWGIYRCEKLSSDSHSVHSEGRAVDWAMDASDRSEKKQAMTLIRKRLLARDRAGNDNALARRMGVQGIIFDCRAWWSGQDGLGDYSYCFKDNGRRRKDLDPTAAHKDHIHIELNWAGAREQTSFWRSRLTRR